MSGEGMIAEARAVHGDAGMIRLKELMARGTEFLGTEWAILGGAMSWISERHLVSAISNAGGFGVIACGAMSPELLDKEIEGTKALTAKPFGVNLITMHPQLNELIDVCSKHEVTHVVLAGGLAARWGDRAHQEPWRQADRLHARARAGQEADALGRRRAGDRGDGGRRPHRPGVDQRAVPGNPAPRFGGHPGVRRRRDRPRRGDRRLSRNGRGRGAARHPLRLLPRMHRPRQFQEGLPSRLGPRRNSFGPDRSAPAGHSGPRAQEPGDGEFRGQAARGRASSWTKARSKWPRPSCRSSIIGPAHFAAR